MPHQGEDLHVFKPSPRNLFFFLFFVFAAAIFARAVTVFSTVTFSVRTITCAVFAVTFFAATVLFIHECNHLLYDRFDISVFFGIKNTGVEMVFQYNLICLFERLLHRTRLSDDINAIFIFFHHGNDVSQLSVGNAKPSEDFIVY